MKNRPARTLGYTAAFFAAFVIFPDITRAQVAPAAPATETVKLEAFTVTGSNIRRIDQESTLPVSVIDFDDIDVRAAPTAAELLQLLPNGGVLSLSETNVLGADARGDNTSLNLRGIGSGNTLVLVNGRRLAPHPISQAEGGVPSLAVNVNQLPVAAIKRVEVLRDGASAIYGADAAAGVVNTILRRDYDGYDVSLRGGQPEGVWLKHATRTTPHADCDRCMFQLTPSAHDAIRLRLVGDRERRRGDRSRREDGRGKQAGGGARESHAALVRGWRGEVNRAMRDPLASLAGARRPLRSRGKNGGR